MTKPQMDMRFGVIRSEVVLSKLEYTPDGEFCHVCNRPTVVSSDVSRRHCSNKHCNALIVNYSI